MIQGASGSPIIALRNNKPEVVGIVSGGQRDILGIRVSVGGSGQLPEYLQKAEHTYQEMIDTEKRRKKDFQEALALELFNVVVCDCIKFLQS